MWVCGWLAGWVDASLPNRQDKSFSQSVSQLDFGFSVETKKNCLNIFFHIFFTQIKLKFNLKHLRQEEEE